MKNVCQILVDPGAAFFKQHYFQSLNMESHGIWKKAIKSGNSDKVSSPGPLYVVPSEERKLNFHVVSCFWNLDSCEFDFDVPIGS